MSKLLNLKSKHGARKKSKRVGRGNASGLGTYAGRGLNGQKSRTGGGVRPGFEGGQTPLYRKMPKLKGFNNVNRVKYQVVNVAKLNSFDDNAEITVETLYEKNMVPSKAQPLKILGEGELTKKVKVTADKFSAEARKKIEAAKGTVVELMAQEQPKEEKAAKAE
ncbi:MAG TPA: 50S ribosomal protein L15 [Candidatus Gracilibacteria bacterium]|nr:50S ribosomal protein L15 [Candidatus Gracilibacteria bacterium]